MKTGIGIISTGDRAISSNITQQLELNCLVSIYVDKDRKGPGYGRNQVIKSLYDSGCEHFFLFDDDVYPLRKNWDTHIINLAQENNLDFIGFPHVWDSKAIELDRGMPVFPGVTVQFAYLSRKCVETVGYFDLRYGKYGPEDITYAYRAHLAGLCGKGSAWTTPLEVISGIYVEDMYSGFEKTVVESEVKKAGMEAGKKYLDELVANSGPIYLSYEQEVNNVNTA
jgi:hypothetical protein